jgi:hypothetical protein
MAPKKFDGLVEVVRYLPSGLIDRVRVYERRGPTYTDLMLLNRAEFLDRLKDGKKFVTGRRVPMLSSTFEVDGPVKLVKTSGGEFITAGDAGDSRDDLKGTPLF